MKTALIAAIAVIGALVAIAASIVFAMVPTITKNMIVKQIPIVKGSDSFKKWESPPVPYYMKFYLFELTNRLNFTNGAKANVVQKGPYVFKEVKQKKVANISSDGSQIVYQEFKSFYFEKELSAGSLDDKINFINIPAISAAKTIMNMDPVLALVYSQVLEVFFKNNDVKIVERKTVREILFDGYRVKFLEDLNKWAKKQFNRTFDSLPDNTFGLFYRKNCTLETENCLDNFVYGINSGVNDVNKVAQYNTLNGSETLKFWNGKYCNMINGTDGSRFHPSVLSSERLYMFNIDLCRSVYFDNTGDAEVKGIQLLKFTPSNDFYKSPYNEPSNECFCVEPKNATVKCQFDGILDISRCRLGAPIFITAPHFYKVDPRIAERVVGLHPDQSIHETFVDIEPNTGLAMNAARRVQVNVGVENYPTSAISLFKKVKDSIVPFLWLEESATIDDNSANEFKQKVQSKIRLLNGLMIAFIVIGLVLILVGVALFAYQRR